MKTLLLLAGIMILITLSPGHLVSGEEAATSASRPSPTSDFCGDDDWTQDPCEFCGSDAYFVTGHADMDHDCEVGFIDAAMFTVAFINQDISADLNGDQQVDLSDMTLFHESYYDPDPVPDCSPCGVLPLGCSGVLRVSFSGDPTQDVDQIPEPVSGFGTVYIVAEGCQNMGAFSFELEAQGVTLLNNVNTCPLGLVGTQFGSGPQLVMQIPYMMDNPGSGAPAWIKIVPCGTPAGTSGLSWASADPPQEIEFALVAHGGINGEPPEDDGCDPGSADCGDHVWTQDPCEFCGSDAYYATGHADMDHDCDVGFIDAAMFAVALINQDLSADLNGDEQVNMTDVALFDASYHDPDPVPDCSPCGVLPVGCSGTLRVNFSSNPAEDLDEIPEPGAGFGIAYIVAEGCQNMGAYSFDLQTQGVTLLDDVPACPLGGIGSEFGSAPQLVLQIPYMMDDPGGGAESWIKIVPCATPAGNSGLAWASADPPREFQFSTVAHGGINAPPPEDDGCFDCNNNGLPDAGETTRQMSFCVAGLSTNVPWTWGIQGPGGVGFSYVIPEQPALPFNADGAAFAAAFVNGINTQTCGTIHAEPWASPFDNCFTVTVPGDQGFEFGVAQVAAPMNWMSYSGGLFSVDFNPTITLVSTTDIPEVRSIHVQSYPNPFNPATLIACELPSEANLTVKIFNTRGEYIKTLIDERVPGGTIEVPWNGTDADGAKVAAGVYFYQVSALGEKIQGKIALIK